MVASNALFKLTSIPDGPDWGLGTATYWVAGGSRSGETAQTCQRYTYLQFRMSITSGIQKRSATIFDQHVLLMCMHGITTDIRMRAYSANKQEKKESVEWCEPP